MTEAKLTNLIHDRHTRGHTKISWLDSHHTFFFYSSDLSEFLLMYEFLLVYDDVRSADSPEQTLLSFFQSAYEAGANLANWDRGPLEKI